MRTLLVPCLVVMAALAGCADEPEPLAEVAPEDAPVVWEDRDLRIDETGAMSADFCLVTACVFLLCCAEWDFALPNGSRVTSVDVRLEAQLGAALPFDVELTVSCRADGARGCAPDTTVAATGTMPVRVNATDLDWDAAGVRVHARSTLPAGFMDGTSEPVRVLGTVAFRVPGAPSNSTASGAVVAG